MPLREFICNNDGWYKEIYDMHTDPLDVPSPFCKECGEEMEMMLSRFRIDTSSTFGAFEWRGPTGMYHDIQNLHQLRQVEKAYEKTGHNVRFDAYSAEPSNPDPIDGFGPPPRKDEAGQLKKQA